MADIPTEILGWATNVVDEVVNIGGNGVLVTNKVEPTQELKDSGVLAREKWARAYMNWLFNYLMRWIDNLNTRENYVGVVKLTTDAGRTEADFEAEFSGSWQLNGSDTLAGTTVFVFERIA
jgi:hypothetical protein